MTWEIVVGLITLCGFLITTISFASKFNSTITECTCAIKELRSALGNMTHDVADHAKRITDCEKDISKINVILDTIEK